MATCPICQSHAYVMHTRPAVDEKDLQCLRCGKVTVRGAEIKASKKARAGSGVIAPAPYRRGTRWGAGW